MELATADIERADPGGASLEEAVCEPARRGAEIEAVLARDVDRERVGEPPPRRAGSPPRRERSRPWALTRPQHEAWSLRPRHGDALDEQRSRFFTLWKQRRAGRRPARTSERRKEHSCRHVQSPRLGGPRLRRASTPSRPLRSARALDAQPPCRAATFRPDTRSSRRSGFASRTALVVSPKRLRAATRRDPRCALVFNRAAVSRHRGPHAADSREVSLGAGGHRGAVPRNGRRTTLRRANVQPARRASLLGLTGAKARACGACRGSFLRRGRRSGQARRSRIVATSSASTVVSASSRASAPSTPLRVSSASSRARAGRGARRR